MTDWNYAQMTKAASLCGGPDQYISAIRAGGFEEGTLRGAFVGAGVTALVVLAGKIAIDRYKERQAAAQEGEDLLSSYLMSGSVEDGNDAGSFAE